jgi:hypothetical protein
VATPILAAERTADRAGDRTKASRTQRGADTSASDMRSGYMQHVPLGVKVGDGQAAAAARSVLTKAAARGGQHAVGLLHQILRMDLPSNPETDKILAETYRRLGRAYEGVPSKQVSAYSAALQYVANPASRARLESTIAELGGDAYALSYRPRESSSTVVGVRGPGDDNCLEAVSVVPDWSEVMSLDFNDENWRTFDVLGPQGEVLTIETITDTPFGFMDDTTLTLFGGCSDDGVGEEFIAFNDDRIENNGCGDVFNDCPGPACPNECDEKGVFTSIIRSGCLIPGTYYVEVGTSPLGPGITDDFTFAVTRTDFCDVPEPDAFEPDDTRADGPTPIGFPTATSPRGNGWGRSHKEVQAHSIFPGGDRDLTELELTQTSLVRVRARAQIGTFFNGFESSSGEANPDSLVEIHYAHPLNYGGFCNEPDIGFPNYCRTDADCPDLPNPIPGFPDCIPLMFFGGAFASIFDSFDPELANNDDIGGNDLGSDLIVCLERTQNREPDVLPRERSSSTNGPWLIEGQAAAGDLFDYELEVRNTVKCPFEEEPNNGPLFGQNEPIIGIPGGDPNVIALGDTINGFYDFNNTANFADDDWFLFDYPEGGTCVESEDPCDSNDDCPEGEDCVNRLTFETKGYEAFEVDTGLQLFVGPGDDKSCGAGAGGTSGDPCETDADCPAGETCNDEYFLAATDDDGGLGFLSRLDVDASSPTELLENEVREAFYYINVTSFFINHNFPYVLETDVNSDPVEHVENPDSDACDTEGAENPTGPNARLTGELGDTCDYDAYKLVLDERTYVEVVAIGTDTVMQMTDCATLEVLGCSDDTQFGSTGGASSASSLRGCLPAGEYCIEVRHFNPFETDDYALELSGTPGCLPDSPPQLGGDELGVCDPEDEGPFDQCP